VQYHYPNQYKNKVTPGSPFIYYRGVHRKNGKRGQAEYFGSGLIGEIRSDPATLGQSRPAWFCSVVDYRPFAKPLPAKNHAGKFYEQIPQNMWRNGVRDLSLEIYNQIIHDAGHISPSPISVPPIGSAIESDGLIVPKSKIASGSSEGGGGWQKSKQSKMIGCWAEETAVKFAREQLGALELTHRAKIGETPGWDFDFKDITGHIHRIEVKGTTAGGFISFDLTGGEYEAAKLHQDTYWLYLVANCLTSRPLIRRVQNPAKLIADKRWAARPILFNVTFGDSC
jgi:hypothetical protein